MPSTAHRSRAKKNILVSTDKNGTRKYRKALVRKKTTRPRGTKNIYPFISRDELETYDQASYESLDYYGENSRFTHQFVFEPSAATKPSSVSIFSLLSEKDQNTLLQDEQIRAKKRRKAIRKALIQLKGGVRFSDDTKTHDGLLPERAAAALFFARILGQTAEYGQGWIKSCQNRLGRWVPNPYSWSPQIAWDAIPDELKRKTAPIIATFFSRWRDAREGRLLKLDVVRWGIVNELEPKCRIIRRERFQILPRGGCDIALFPEQKIQQEWVDKMRSSPTIQSILRAPISAIPSRNW